VSVVVETFELIYFQVLIKELDLNVLLREVWTCYFSYVFSTYTSL